MKFVIVHLELQYLWNKRKRTRWNSNGNRNAHGSTDSRLSENDLRAPISCPPTYCKSPCFWFRSAPICTCPAWRTLSTRPPSFCPARFSWSLSFWTNLKHRGVNPIGKGFELWAVGFQIAILGFVAMRCRTERREHLDAVLTTFNYLFLNRSV